MNARGTSWRDAEEEPPGPNGAVAVLYNRDFLPGGSGVDAMGQEAGEEAVEIAERVAGLLAERGHQVVLIGADDDAAAPVREARALGVSRVFNLVESLGGDGRREHEVPIELEAYGIPYTGNGPEALLAAQAKHVARKMMRAHGVRVPDAAVVWGEDDLAATAPLGFPLFVKPACADGSIGIDQGSVVHDRRALRARLAWLRERIPGPYLVETYLPHRELNVALVPNAAGSVAVTEIVFQGYPADYAPIVTYDCKWTPGGPESGAYSRPVSERDLGARTYRDVVDQARRAFTAIGGSSYGRVDLRLDAGGRARVIDINPNPDLHPEAGFCIAAAHAGLPWEDLILALLADARVDGQRRPAHGSPTAPELSWTSPSAP
ncbi:MAG: hypothetical protein EP329_27955 [Deltaproteobacteria bacterium]|nr:MAG: hypothetical protein EP329_27955 [Deltaproteobacteria bacterium]